MPFTSTDSDLINLLKKAKSSPAKVRKLLEEIEGVGKVGTDILILRCCPRHLAVPGTIRRP